MDTGHTPGSEPGLVAQSSEERSTCAEVYDGVFELAWLKDDERVRSAGDGSGAADIENLDGELLCRLHIGEVFYRDAWGRPTAAPRSGAPKSAKSGEAQR